MIYSFGARGRLREAESTSQEQVVATSTSDGRPPAGRNVVKKYKLKTHKGTAKRIKFTGSGLALRENAARTKYRRKKRGEIVRGLKRQTRVAAGDAGNVRRLLPYG